MTSNTNLVLASRLKNEEERYRQSPILVDEVKSGDASAQAILYKYLVSRQNYISGKFKGVIPVDELPGIVHDAWISIYRYIKSGRIRDATRFDTIAIRILVSTAVIYTRVHRGSTNAVPLEEVMESLCVDPNVGFEDEEFLSVEDQKEILAAFCVHVAESRDGKHPRYGEIMTHVCAGESDEEIMKRLGLERRQFINVKSRAKLRFQKFINAWRKRQSSRGKLLREHTAC